MIKVAILLNLFFVLFMFAILVYVLSKQPSKIQLLLSMLIITTIITIAGYMIEMNFHLDIEKAMIGVNISYIGKPFAILCAVLFISEYCGKLPNNTIIFSLTILASLFTTIVFTNEYHYLYYSFVGQDLSATFSSLKLGRGPIYYVYMAYMVASFIWIIILIAGEAKKSKTKEAKARVRLLLYMALSVILGYVVYLTGITGGYDTTMIGTGIAVIFLAILFFKYALFDYLTFAKETAINEASDGILVLNDRGESTFQNLTVHKLLKNKIFSLGELDDLSCSTTVIPKGDKVYKIKKDLVENKGRNYGYTFEITDITSEYNYTEKLSQEVAKKTKNIKDIQESVIISFASMVEARDETTGDHIIRMSKYAQIVANEMLKNGDYKDSINPSFISCLYKVSPLHDVGKIVIPDSILLKPGKLEESERDVIKTHSRKGAQIIEKCFKGLESEEYVSMAMDVAAHHHERWNGQGYPDKLKGEAIPLSARIVSIADVYDALRSDRPYKKAFSKEEAKNMILQERGQHFDPIVVDAFIRCLPQIEALTIDNN